MGPRHNPETIATAYHEAGHYLVSRLLHCDAPDVRLGQLSIERDASSEGRLELWFDAVGNTTDPPFGFPRAASPQAELVLIWVHLAGREAQWIGTGVRPKVGHLADWVEARIRAIRTCYPDADLEPPAEAITAALERGDWTAARDQLLELSRRYETVRPLLHRYQREVRELLRAHEDALEALKDALLERGHLTHDEAEMLYSGVGSGT